MEPDLSRRLLQLRGRGRGLTAPALAGGGESPPESGKGGRPWPVPKRQQSLPAVSTLHRRRENAEEVALVSATCDYSSPAEAPSGPSPPFMPPPQPQGLNEPMCLVSGGEKMQLCCALGSRGVPIPQPLTGGGAGGPQGRRLGQEGA